MASDGVDRLFNPGRPDDRIIVGAGPVAVMLSHFGDGRITVRRRDGEVFAVNANRLAVAIGDIL
jgi:hypothetical protein